MMNLLFWQPFQISKNFYNIFYFFSYWYIWLIVGIISLFFLFKKAKEPLFFLWISLAVAQIIEAVLKHLSPWDRPFIELGLTPPDWLTSYSQGSFPSGHAMKGIIVLYFLFLYHKKIFILALPGVLIMDYTRIYFGLHYPIDILGGSIIGLVVIFILNYFLKNNDK
jgi:undecaprenyl-diphosphatase